MVTIQPAGPKHRCWRAIRWPGRGARSLIQRLISRAAQIHLEFCERVICCGISLVFLSGGVIVGKCIMPIRNYIPQMYPSYLPIVRTVSFEYILGRITMILRTRRASHLPVQRASTRYLDRQPLTAACLQHARNARYVRLNPSTRIAQPCGNPVNGQHNYSPQLLNLWARTFTQGAQFTERVNLKIVQRIHIGITQLD